MSHVFQTRSDPSTLRQRAQSNLRAGTRAGSGRVSTSDALTALHQLASAPATAADALALLHELQVHQVELDLQEEELRRACTELEAALLRQTARVERSPAGCLTIDSAGTLLEINAAGARLLGAAPDDLLGRPLTACLAPQGADRLHTLLAMARDGQEPQTCLLQAQPLAGAVRELHASASLDSTPGQFLLVLMAAASATAPAQRPA